MADPLVALAAYLATDTNVRLSLGDDDHVYPMEMPADQSARMAARLEKCVILSPSGGTNPIDDVPRTSQRVDVRCYGESPYEARQLYYAVQQALKSLRRSAQGDVLLHFAAQESGAMGLRDQDVEWPFVLSVWAFTASDAVLV